MSKRNLLNLALLIFILVLVAVVVYEPGKEKTVTPPTLTHLKTDDIQHIKINRQLADTNEQDIIFEKTTEGWIMLEPYQLTAVTVSDTCILILERETFLELIQYYPNLSLSLLRNLAQRFEKATALLQKVWI